MQTIRNVARERLERGELSLGVGIRMARKPEIAMMMATSGYDWLFIDLEHGALSVDVASDISVAALSVGIAPIVRVPKNEFTMATRLLDNGAMGVVMPHVDTADEAHEFVEKVKYPPVGHRSASTSLPHLNFQPKPIGEISKMLNAATLAVAMIESPEALENCEAIAAVPGIDIVLIGTNDLALEMGIPGDFGNPKIEAAYRRIHAACEKHGKWMGMGGVYDDELLRHYVSIGPRFVLCGTDFAFLIRSAKAQSAFVRGLDV